MDVSNLCIELDKGFYGLQQDTQRTDSSLTACPMNVHG